MRGIRLPEEHKVIAMVIPAEGGKILTCSENGFGKRTEVSEYPTKGRGSQGVIAMAVSERNGSVTGAVQIFDGDGIMLISDQGTLVRTRGDEVSLSGRNTQGVRLIKVKEGEHIVGVQRVEDSSDDDVDESVTDGEAEQASGEE